MSDEYAVRPTDEELAGWADPEGEAGLYFPEYYVERHYELLQGMFEELIESRATTATEEWKARAEDAEAIIARVEALIPNAAVQASKHATPQQRGFLEGKWNAWAKLRFVIADARAELESEQA